MSENNSIHYFPDKEEIDSAIVFMNNCSDKDLVESWARISGEWDVNSLTELHRWLCESGRINDLVSFVSNT